MAKVRNEIFPEDALQESPAVLAPALLSALSQRSRRQKHV